jgi:uncharacterized protein involved in exopolysaccharide biosynthesis/Mrp family chromosome partitioning ATPase
MERFATTNNSTETSVAVSVLETHLSDYLEILWRRKWIVIIFFLFIVIGVTIYSLMATPQYKATAKILLGGQPSLMNPLGETDERLPERIQDFKAQVNLLRNRTLARHVIKDLAIDEAYIDRNASSLKRVIARLWKNDNEKKQNTEPLHKEGQKHVSAAKILQWYLSHLEIAPISDSSLVDVSFIGSNAQFVTKIANTHARYAIRANIERRQSLAMEALDWLKQQIESQEREVELSRMAIYDFKKKNNVLSLEENQIVFSQELQELNSSLAEAKSNRITKQAVYDQLKNIRNNRQNVLLMPEISNYPVIQQLRTQLVDLKSKKIEMGTKYGKKHPKMIELIDGIEQIEREIASETDRLIQAIEAEMRRALTIENSLEHTLDKQKQVAMTLGQRAIEYEVLNQQAQSAQDVYDFLLKQSEELGLSSAINTSNMRIVDQAEIPVEPIRPRLVFNLLIAIVSALFFGTAAAFFMDYFDNTVNTPMEASVKLGLPVIGMIPYHKAFQKVNSKDGLLADVSTPSKKELTPSLYHISNRLPNEMRTPAEGLFGRVLMVESVTMQEGKTTIISRIGANLAEAGLNVLLVDCDFQRPSLEKTYHITQNGGLGAAVNQIMAHQITTGSLADYSMDDLFFLIALHKQSGQLMVSNDDDQLAVHFQNGVLVHIQSNYSLEHNRIGNMLLNGGFISQPQLTDALRRHQRTGQPIGYILVNAGYLGREKLRGPLRLQIEEYLQKIFSWKEGQFDFKPGAVSIYDNARIFFEEDYSPIINTLNRTASSKFMEKNLYTHIVNVWNQNLFLLPAGSSYRLIGSLNQVLMKKILEKLRQRFDIVLIDTPPLDAASGIESIVQLADGIVLVIKAGHLRLKILKGAIQHLPSDKIIGAILNQVHIKPRNYYY